jgi:hypothetical protein
MTGASDDAEGRGRREDRDVGVTFRESRLRWRMIVMSTVPDDLALALRLGGELGGRVATFDWEHHAFGRTDEWPEWMRTETSRRSTRTRRSDIRIASVSADAKRATVTMSTSP